MTQQKHLENEILRLLHLRNDGVAPSAQAKTICPSEAARAVALDNWEPLMQPARDAAQRLVAAKKIVITQRGKIVDGPTTTGPIRLRLR